LLDGPPDRTFHVRPEIAHAERRHDVLVRRAQENRPRVQLHKQPVFLRKIRAAIVDNHATPPGLLHVGPVKQRLLVRTLEAQVRAWRQRHVLVEPDELSTVKIKLNKHGKTVKHTTCGLLYVARQAIMQDWQAVSTHVDDILREFRSIDNFRLTITFFRITDKLEQQARLGLRPSAKRTAGRPTHRRIQGKTPIKRDVSKNKQQRRTG
jgi:hypothetical protein